MYSVNRKDGRHTPFGVSPCVGTSVGRFMQCFLTRLMLVDLECGSQTVLLTVGCCTALFSHPFRLWCRFFGTVTASVFWICYITERLLLRVISDPRREVTGILLLLLFLNPEVGTDRLSRNVGKKLPRLYACYCYTGKVKQSRYRPGVAQRVLGS